MASQFSVKQHWPAVLCVLLLAVWIIRPIGMEAPRSVASDFDGDRAMGRLETILGDEQPHPADSDASDALLVRLLGEIRQAGFAPEVRERFHCNDVRQGAAICARTRNIIFWVTSPGDDALLIAAHHDSVPTGPGAADDGMGVAIAIEVAHILRKENPGRPTLVLLTDAEEAGLVGAAAFAKHDPLASKIGAVINLEARGTTGSASMFQTSTPNGRDISALQGGEALPSANSLASDLYRILPNDTDLTMLLPLGIDAANYAIIGGGKRYHTPLDNLANLDRASFRHMGASALAAARGFAANTHAKSLDEAEANMIFTDLLQRVLLVLPAPFALVALLSGLVAGAVLWMCNGGNSLKRSLFAPPVALLLGGGLAIGAGVLLAALRPEAAFGSAWPVMPRAVYAAAALFGACIALWLLRPAHGMAVAAATWVWLALLLLASFAWLPGLATTGAWALMLVLCAGLVLIFPKARHLARWLLLAAALLYALIALPLAGGIENGLFVEYSAPATVFLIFLLLMFLPFDHAGGRVVSALSVCGVALVIAFVVALLVPAYSVDTPRHLSIVHEDDGKQAAFLIENNGPLPSRLAAAAAFAASPDPQGNWRATAPRIANAGRIAIISDSTEAGRRTIRFQASAPFANIQDFTVEKGKGVQSVTVNGAKPEITGPLRYIGCTGRSCRTLDITLVLDAAQPLPELRWQQYIYGAGAAAETLVAARPADAQPVHTGDRRMLVREVDLASGAVRPAKVKPKP